MTARYRNLVVVYVITALLSLVTSAWGKDAQDVTTACKDILGVFPEWEIVKCDTTPSVTVADCQGYRILLRHGHKLYQAEQQQRETQRSEEELKKLKYVMKYSHIEVVLFPKSMAIVGNIKSQIQWEDLEQEYFTKAVYLGKAKDYIWFGRMAIFRQEQLREKLGIKGGEDRLKLAAEGLGVKDDGNMTANSCTGILQRNGKRSIPYIEAAIKANTDKEPWHSVVALGYIQHKRSTEILKTLYASPNNKLSRAAAYVLVYMPYRKSAQAEYFDMLGKQVYVKHAAHACTEFGWKDAMPLLQSIYEKPSRWRHLRYAFEAMRKLQKKEAIPKELLAAEEVLKTADYRIKPPELAVTKEAMDVIINAKDKEAASVVAISLALARSKGGIPKVNQIGRTIIKQLPAETTKPMIYALISSACNEWEKRKISELY